jgi:hypothetical protein
MEKQAAAAVRARGTTVAMVQRSRVDQPTQRGANMDKRVLCWLLAGIGAIGCGAQTSSPPATGDPGSSAATKSRAPTMVGRNANPARTSAGARSVALSQGCWVTLEWCQDPITGGPVCSWDPTQCDYDFAVEICNELIADYC